MIDALLARQQLMRERGHQNLKGDVSHNVHIQLQKRLPPRKSHTCAWH